MIAAQRATGKLLAINWPIRWSPCYITTKRLIDEGVIGDVLNVHHYGGNRGPLFHLADKIERTPTAEDKGGSWFYKRTQGGGSLLDMRLRRDDRHVVPRTQTAEVTCVVDEPPGLEVDEHSVTVCRYPWAFEN
jgi:glucose-fructose oxidoreductase